MVNLALGSMVSETTEGFPSSPRPPRTPGEPGRNTRSRGPKGPHAKARAGGPKARDRSRDHRLLSGCLRPPFPAKPLNKKPERRRGCKCGGATQTPPLLLAGASAAPVTPTAR